MAQATTRLRLGACVTSPGTREPSVAASASRGARRSRVRAAGSISASAGATPPAAMLGKPPTTLSHARGSDQPSIPALVAGRTRSRYEGTELELPWTWQMDAAGVGRRLRSDGDLSMAGRVADGLSPPARRSAPRPLVRRPGCADDHPGRRARSRLDPQVQVGARRRPRRPARRRPRAARAGSRRSSRTTSSTSSTSTRASSSPAST